MWTSDMKLARQPGLAYKVSTGVYGIKNPVPAADCGELQRVIVVLNRSVDEFCLNSQVIGEPGITSPAGVGRIQKCTTIRGRFLD